MSLPFRSIRSGLLMLMLCVCSGNLFASGVFITDLSDPNQTKDRIVASFESLLKENRIPVAMQSGELAGIVKWARANHRLEHCIYWLGYRIEENPRSLYLRMAMADCLLLSKHWQQLSSSLREEQWHYQEHIRLAYVACAERELGQSDWSGYWQQSKDNASVNPEMLKSLMVLISGWPQWEAEQETMLWSQIEGNTGLKTWASKRLNRFYIAHEDPAGLARFNQYLLQLEPENLDLINNEIIYAILNGQTDSIGSAMADLFSQNMIRRPEYQLTWALYLNAAGKQDEAYQTMLNLPREWMERPEHALYCAKISRPFSSEWSRKLESIGKGGDYMGFEKHYLLQEAD